MSRANLDGGLSGLLERCRAGDPRAWRELVERFQGFVYSIPKRMGLGEDDAADVFQATFVALHRALDRMESSQALPKWLAVTAAREAWRLRRTAAKIPSSSWEVEEGKSLEDVVADQDRTAEALAIEACDARTVRVAVARLNDRCSKLLSALYLEADLSYVEVSERVGIPVGAIGPTRARCLEKLRRILDEEGFFDD